MNNNLNSSKIFDTKISVAPMLDWTDRHCRFFHRQLSSKALLYTEMIVADAIIHGNRDNFLSFNIAEHPIAVQLGGSDPAKLAEATAIAFSYGYDEINLNVGCPSNRVQNGAFGACLMLNPDLVARCIKSMKDATKLPVTIKCRIAVDDQDPIKALDDLVEKAIDVGVDGFWVHARKAWLNGLSPKENRTIPPLDYKRVYVLKEKYPECYIGINGGIDSVDAAQQHLQYVDGVMIGREAYKNPLYLWKLHNSVYNDEEFSYDKLINTMCHYADIHIANGGKLSHITRHMLGLFSGMKGARTWRSILTSFSTKRDASGEDLRIIFDKVRNLNYES